MRRTTKLSLLSLIMQLMLMVFVAAISGFQLKEFTELKETGTYSMSTLLLEYNISSARTLLIGGIFIAVVILIGVVLALVENSNELTNRFAIVGFGVYCDFRLLTYYELFLYYKADGSKVSVVDIIGFTLYVLALILLVSHFLAPKKLELTNFNRVSRAIIGIVLIVTASALAYIFAVEENYWDSNLSLSLVFILVAAVSCIFDMMDHSRLFRQA